MYPDNYIDLIEGSNVIIENNIRNKLVFINADDSNDNILYSDKDDVRYHCVCVEQTDFAPILFEDVIKRIEAEGGTVGFKSGNGPTM